jgi:hypothetical protein
MAERRHEQGEEGGTVNPAHENPYEIELHARILQALKDAGEARIRLFGVLEILVQDEVISSARARELGTMTIEEQRAFRRNSIAESGQNQQRIGDLEDTLAAAESAREDADRIAAEAIREKAALLDAVSVLLQAFDDGIFLRNTDHDNRPDWGIRLFNPLRALAVLRESMDG